MSSSQGQERPWSFYVQDMLGFAETVLDYTSGLDMDAFIADRRPMTPPCAISNLSARLPLTFLMMSEKPIRRFRGTQS